MPYSKSNLLKRRFGCFLDVPMLKNLAAELTILLGNQQNNLEGLMHGFIHKSCLFSFSSLCGIHLHIGPLKKGAFGEEIPQ